MTRRLFVLKKSAGTAEPQVFYSDGRRVRGVVSVKEAVQAGSDKPMVVLKLSDTQLVPITKPPVKGNKH